MKDVIAPFIVTLRLQAALLLLAPAFALAQESNFTNRAHPAPDFTIHGVNKILFLTLAVRSVFERNDDRSFVITVNIR